MDSHSNVCAGKWYKDEQFGLDIERDMKKLVNTRSPVNQKDLNTNPQYNMQ